MLIFLKQNLVFFAVPKTGTTALEEALRPHCSIDLRDPPTLRHMNAGLYHNKWGPWLAETYDLRPQTMAILRDPLERLRSWYRYRQAPIFHGKPLSALGVPFEQFLEQTLAADPPAYAQVGSQDRFCLSAQDGVRIRHLFVYEDLPRATQFLEERLKRKVAMPVRNVSPRAQTPLSAELEARVRQARAREFRLYAKVAEQGYLETPGAH
jgi:hypothetical protein